ncbi:MAG: glycosyltransferase family A protein [Bryobacteraceae bacterium]
MLESSESPPPAPRVTVIIPTYNWSSVLPYSIGSVLRQSFTDFELLVIGDGCTDDSESVVAAIPDPRVRWINLAVGGGHQSAPNNEGLRQARGSIIAYLGHDDLWLPHHLEVLVAAIDAGGDLVHSIIHMIDTDGNAMRPPAGVRWYEPGLGLPPSCVAHRRSATDKVGFWGDYRDLPIDPEADLWARMYRAGLKLQRVARLTAVKFPASGRKDAYKKKLCIEQQEWTQRILTHADLEAVELGKQWVVATQKRAAPTRMSVLFQALLQRTKKDSAAWRLLYFIRRVVSLGELRAPENGTVISQMKKFKGLPTGD